MYLDNCHVDVPLNWQHRASGCGDKRVCMPPQFSRHFAAEGQVLQLHAAADLENEQAVVDVETEQQGEDGNQEHGGRELQKGAGQTVSSLWLDKKGRGGAGHT